VIRQQNGLVPGLAPSKSREHTQSVLYLKVVNILDTFQPPRLPPDVYYARLVHFGDEFLNSKEYRLALSECYQRFMQTPAEKRTGGRTQADDEQVALETRTKLGMATCSFFLAMERDPELRQPSTVDVVVQQLCEVRRTCEEVAAQGADAYFLVYNGTISIFTLCSPLIAFGYAQLAVEFLLFAALSMEAQVALCQAKYVGWRARLYAAVCLAYEESKMRPEALAFAERGLAEVRKLQGAEALDPVPPPADMKRKMAAAELEMVINVLRHSGSGGPNGAEALKQLGYEMENLVEKERDAALGNGGLGRLAACFLDSMASENLPAWGYGIRYQYGMFRQEVIEGFQHENPDYWLNFGNPWEIERPNIAYPIKFYGNVEILEVEGRQAYIWNSGEEVTAIAYDTPIPGWNTPNTINMRLWSAKPSREFDLESFNTGDYVQAILAKQRAETISAVLYPDDRTYQGKELRLKQQFFMVSATLQDIIRRYLVTHEDTFDDFPDKVALQLNDTHPTIGVPELMRLLMDEHGLGWTKAWDITTRVFSFTNHTVLPEALEKWPVDLVENVLPRHMQIIYDINWRFTQELRGIMGDDYDTIGRMSIIEEGDGMKNVRMAHLALIASHTVNGVAAIHSELIKTTIFKDFYQIMPEKFQNKTNGVTQRRWLAFCNPKLSDLITETLGTSAWIKELDLLSDLRLHCDDPAFQAKWAAVKRDNKLRLAELVKQKTGVDVNPNALFDIQVKRIHEYKRQLLNVMYIIHRYNALKAMTPAEREKQVARCVIIGGKAAPGYDMAKRIIKLISAVGDTVNADPEIGDKLQLVFLPDYNVSSAEIIVPGSELSQHISTAGTEASGTSNMKFAMNGCLIIGTMDGANVEIAEEIGQENMFIFGARADVVPGLRREREFFNVPEEFYTIVDQIRNGYFGWSDFFAPVCDAVCGAQDFYLLANDFNDYIRAQEEVDENYLNQALWTKKSILSVAGSGKFSSDRTIRQYAEDIWDVKPAKRPMPTNPKPYGKPHKM